MQAVPKAAAPYVAGPFPSMDQYSSLDWVIIQEGISYAVLCSIKKALKWRHAPPFEWEWLDACPMSFIHLAKHRALWQVAEIKRAVFRALTRLRAATIKDRCLQLPR